MQAEEAADFGLESAGPFELLHPLNPQAEKWIKENLTDVQPWQKFGLAVAIEHRFTAEIVKRILADGFNVKEF